MRCHFGHVVWGGALVALGSLFLMGCSAAGDPPGAGEPVAKTQETVTAAVPAQKEITIASTPNAKCIVQPSNATDSSQSMPVWADDVGLVHLWAAQKSSSEAYSVDCSGDGDTAKHVFDLADAATFVPATAAFAPVGRTTRPALTDPLGPSAADLVKGGYPPRPDPNLAPSSYKKWLNAVSKPATLIPPHLVERPDLHFAGNTWCGYVLDNASTRYIVSVEQFYTPIFVPATGSTSSNSALWAGLDGYGTADVIQDGVDYASTGSVGSYSAWYEYFCPGTPTPAACRPVFNTSMVVSASDEMLFWSWEADSSCTYGSGHTGYGCFWYEDETTLVQAGDFIVTAPNNSFGGATVEGIMESQQGVALSPWYFSNMEFDGWDTSLTEHNINSDSSQNITLFGASDTMATTSYAGYPDVANYNFENSN